MDLNSLKYICIGSRSQVDRRSEILAANCRYLFPSGCQDNCCFIIYCWAPRYRSRATHKFHDEEKKRGRRKIQFIATFFFKKSPPKQFLWSWERNKFETQSRRPESNIITKLYDSKENKVRGEDFYTTGSRHRPIERRCSAYINITTMLLLCRRAT